MKAVSAYQAAQSRNYRPGPWQKTPWYLFWKPPYRRTVWLYVGGDKFDWGRMKSTWAYAAAVDFLLM